LLREDFDEPRMVMRIVSFEGRPFAYAQDHAVHVWPRPHFAHLPFGARAIDSFIGAPDMIGCGHGSVFLRLLASGSGPRARRSSPSIPMRTSAHGVPTRRHTRHG
jgi:hypothetical protein